MQKRASKLKKDFRIREDPDFVITGQAFSLITSYMSENSLLAEDKLEE